MQKPNLNVTKFEHSEFLLQFTHKVNINTSIAVITVGLLGNLIIKIVFFKKKFQINSSHIYLLSSTISDSLYLLIQLFEDTVASFCNLYSLNNSFIVNILNIANYNHLTCQSISYLRYLLRFISSYIVVLFTIQRLYMVSKPLSIRFKSIKSAWQTVGMITLISLVINLWVPFIFQINTNESNDHYCDINKEFKREYFILNLVYIWIVMLIPMIIILICNLVIMVKTCENNSKKKKKELNKSSFTKVSSNTIYEARHMINRKSINFEKSTPKLTCILMAISFSFVFLNLPYLILWTIYFYQIGFYQIDTASKNYLFALLHIAEIFYFINYGLNFFIICVTESFFRNKLKNK